MQASRRRAFGRRKLPAAALFSGYPFGPDAAGYFDWFEQGNGRKLYQEMYDHAGLKVHVMPCAFGGAETGGWFKKEIKAPDDIKGLRMRIFGLGGRVMSRLGAITVLVPGGDLLAAFEKGQIDAAELYPPAVDERQPLKDKVKLIYAPGWHQPETVLELIVNKDRWDALSDHQRGLIESACLATLAGDARRKRQASGRSARQSRQARRQHRAFARSRAGRLARVPGARSPRKKATGTISSGPCSKTSRNSAPRRAAPPSPEPKVSAEPAGSQNHA